jgi:hypothetical protein
MIDCVILWDRYRLDDAVELFPVKCEAAADDWTAAV